MASADLRDELTCSICTDIYTDPVSLLCGHSYCWLCIGEVLDTQDKSGAYKCPECRAEFQVRPALEKNRKLCNIAESFQSTHSEQHEVSVPCTYCDSPVPAAKTCLMCEASLCEKHLKKHSKSAEHVLTEPTTSLENRKCSVHKEILKYYCCEDAACICVSCSLAGEHRGHQVETLNVASEKKKENLRIFLLKLTSDREKAEKEVQNLQELKRQVPGKAARVTEGVTALIRNIREQLEALERRVLSEISAQEEHVSLRISDLIQQLEIKKEELSKKMGHIEELCSMTDPVTVLQGGESGSADCCDPEERDNEYAERHDINVHNVGDLSLFQVSITLRSGLAGIVTGLTKWCRVVQVSDMLLDVNITSDMLLDANTAAYDVYVTWDLKTVSRSRTDQWLTHTPERFNFNQVLSSKRFTTGRHYWEVEVSKSGVWAFGIAYPSIARRGRQSKIGCNNKSWVLERWDNNVYSVIHRSKIMYLPHPLPCRRFGIFLDYEAGRLSFYELGDPIKHIHTFTAAFTEPLHAAFGVYEGNTWVKI